MLVSITEVSSSYLEIKLEEKTFEVSPDLIPLPDSGPKIRVITWNSTPQSIESGVYKYVQYVILHL